MRWLAKIREERGVAAVEAAIVLPIFLMFFFYLVNYACVLLVTNLVDRYAVAACYIARTASDRTAIQSVLESKLESSVPRWLRTGGYSIQAWSGDTLNDIPPISGSPNGFGTDKQTVRLKISVTTKFPTLFSVGSIFEIPRTVVLYYVNEGSVEFP